MLETIHASLQTVAQLEAAIRGGEPLFLAGSRDALQRLPRGNWVAGTIPYFMTDDGGLLSEDRVFATPVPACAVSVKPAVYGASDLAALYREAPLHGFTFLVLPAATEVHKTFAERASSFDGFLLKPMVGWVTGVRVDRIGAERPAVIDGMTGELFEDRCAALHLALPANKIADLDIVNIFDRGDGPTIRFDDAGFKVRECLIDGGWANLASYVTRHGIPTEFPLVGDYNGSAINVSFQKVDAQAGTVDFYAPVFPGVNYHFAKPVADYEKAFAEAIGNDSQEPEFACNCILNYLYGKLEGKKTGHVTGPITFGEVAHQLLNQTMVRLYLRDIG